MKELDNLIEQAKREGKWLYCCYQQLWFSPDELRAENEQGRFRWGTVNWQLRDPVEKLEQMVADSDSLKAGIGTFALRIQSSMSTSLGDK
jgi:hypothetical protein